jgi:micrococcal nuclease
MVEYRGPPPRSKSRWVALVILTLLLVALAAFAVRRRSASQRLGPGEGVVVDVIDGDTVAIRIAGSEERVRLLGIDTPETVDPTRPPECFGAEASARTRELLPEGTVVVLQRDVEPRDHFGRLLAFVFRRRDRLLVNRQLLAEGLATPLVIAPNDARRAEMAAVAAEARRTGRGMWAACARDPPG